MKAPVAIEINEQYLKIVTAKSFVKQRQLTDCLFRSIADLDDKKISELISGIFRQEKIRPHPVVVCVPRNQVTVRTLHLPSRDRKEIDQMLELHIGRIVPYKKEEVLFDYVVFGTDEMNYTKLMLAIVHRDILKRQAKILEAAGLFIDRMCLSSYGIWEFVLSTQKSEVSPTDLYLALDVDSAYTDFIIFNREHILFNRGIAMELKDTFGPTEMTKLLGEVRQSLVIFHNEESNKNPLKIFLSGAPLVVELEKLMHKEFDIPVRLISLPHSPQLLKAKKRDIPKNISFSAVSQFALEDFPKRISFILPEIQIRKTLRERTRELMIIGSLVIYFFSALLLFSWGKLSNEQGYLRRLQQYNASIEKDVGGLLRDYQRIKFVKDFLYRRQYFLAMVGELQKITPPNIAIDSIVADESGHLTLKGRGSQPSEVFKFVTTIEDSKYFKDAAAKSTRTRKLEDKEVTNFEIIFLFTIEELQIKK